MARDQLVQLFHWNAHAVTSGRPLPRFRRAGVIAILPAFAGADRHGTAALRAMNEAGKQRRAAHDARWHIPWVASLQVRLHRVKRLLIDDRGDIDHDGLGLRFELPVFATAVEFMASGIGRARQNLVDRTKIEIPIDSMFSLSDAPAAFARMASGQHFGKIVLDLEAR